jgi:hypothetical protein
MSETSRRGLLKGALAGSVFLIRAHGAPGLAPAAEVQEDKSRLEEGTVSGAPVSGAPCGPTTSVQYNAGGGSFGGSANFELSPAGVLKIGPREAEIPPNPTSVPRIQLATSTLAKIETHTIETMAAMALVDNSTTASSTTNAEDGFVISRNYMPSGTVASNFGFSGMTIGISDDPSNTQDQSGAYLIGLSIYAKLLSPTTIGNAASLEVFNTSVINPGQTQTIASIIGVYTETLLGDGVNTATYNVTLAVGLNIGTTGFRGPQSGTIETSWGLNIEGPRLGAGTGSITSRNGIRIASQNQGNPGGRNPNSWAIHEDDPLDRNALGSINLGGDAGPLISAGNGSPEGVVPSVVGGLYLRLDGGANSTLYVKESGTGNTGWVAK